MKFEKVVYLGSMALALSKGIMFSFLRRNTNTPHRKYTKHSASPSKQPKLSP